MSLITLIIDTTTEKSLISFTCGTVLLLTLFLPVGMQSSRHLMGHIEKGFETIGSGIADLKTIAVAAGPGLFTGIRTAAAAAYGLALPRQLPLVSFCSLQGYVSAEEGKFASLIDARIGGQYVLLQERKGERVELLGSPCFIKNDDLENYLSGIEQRVGPHLAYADDRHLAQLVEEKFQKKEFSKKLDLVYLT